GRPGLDPRRGPRPAEDGLRGPGGRLAAQRAAGPRARRPHRRHRPKPALLRARHGRPAPRGARGRLGPRRQDLDAALLRALAAGLGRIAARRARVPVTVHTFHGHVLSGYLSGPQTRVLTAAERALAKRTDALVSVSTRVRDELLALGIGRPEQWRVVPLGLELGDLLRGPAERSASRAALGLPPQGPLVGIVGRLAAIKDHGTFLEMAAKLASARTDVSF